MKKALALVLALTMTLGMAACGTTASSTSTAASTSTAGGDSTAASSTATTGTATSSMTNGLYPGTADPESVTINITSEPPDMNSVTTTDATAISIMRDVLEGLTSLDQENKPVPGVAESWDISEDGLVYTFHLRDNALWSNGEPVTANDFVFAWTQLFTAETGANYATTWQTYIKGAEQALAGDPSGLGVKAVDDYTLEVTFNTPLAYALHLFAFQTYLPVNEKIYEAAGKNSSGGSLYNSEPDLMGYNGPYYVESWTHNTELVLAKNPDYYNADDIKIEKIKYTMMKDSNARMNAYQGGQVDCINLTADQIDQMKSMNEPIHTYVDNGNWYFQFNLQTPALQSAKVRKALGDAIDPQSYIDNVLRDGSQLANGLVPTSINGANGGKYVDGREDLMDHDTAGAKALFDEGLKELNLTAADVKLTYVCDDTSRSQTEAAYFQQQWKELLGIDVDISPMAFEARLDAMTNGNFDIVFAGWSPDYNDAMTYLDMFMKDNGNNYGKYDNPEYDELLNQAMAEKDATKRQEILHQAETILIQEDYVVYPIYFSVINYVCSNKLSGMTRTGFQEFDFCDGAEIVS